MTESVVNIAENIEPKFVKCERIMKMRLLRNLTILGKITLIQSLIASQFLYLMQSFILPHHVLQRINCMFFKFIWSKGKYKEQDLKNVPEKVKRDCLVQDYANGGLKMIDMFDLQTAFALKWIKQLFLEGNGTWRCLPTFYFGQFAVGLSVFNCSSNINVTANTPIFYRDILSLWDKHKTDTDKSIIWNNNLIKISGQTVCFKNWIDKGINNIGDITKDNRLMTYEELATKIGKNPRALIQYLGIKSVISNNLIQQFGNVERVNKNVYFNGKSITKCTAADFREFIVKKGK